MTEVTFTRKSLKKHNRVQNIIKLLFMFLIQDNQSAEDYAKQLSCSVPAVKKYIQEIRKSYDAWEQKGFDIIYKDKKYRLFSDVKFPAFEAEEIEALYLAIKYHGQEEGSPFKNLDGIAKKLRKYFTKACREKMNKPIEFSGPGVKSNLNDLIEQIDDAIENKKKISITYMPTYKNNTVERQIVPYALLYHDHEWYIRAFCLKDRKIKSFSVNQIIHIKEEEITERERKELPENPPLKPTHRWDWSEDETCETPVKIRFTGPEGEKIKKKFAFRREHPSQKVEETDKGTTVSFTVKNPFNMMNWILQFGSSAEVLEPESLREQIKREINSIKALY